MLFGSMSHVMTDYPMNFSCLSKHFHKRPRTSHAAERVAEKNDNPTRESVMESGAVRPKEHLIGVHVRATRTRAARRGAARRGRTRAAATAVSYHIVYASVQCGKPRRAKIQTKRKREEERRREGLAAGRRERRGGGHREKKEKEEGTTRQSSI